MFNYIGSVHYELSALIPFMLCSQTLKALVKSITLSMVWFNFLDKAMMKHYNAQLSMLLGFLGFHPYLHNTTLLGISVPMQ